MRLTPILTALALGCFALPSAASPVRVVASDDRGVTLELTVQDYRLDAALAGRQRLSAPGLELMDLPGRPVVPFASALIGLPPGAGAQVRLLSADTEEERTTRLPLGERPVFRGQPGSTQMVPDREPVPAVLDGSWPRTTTEAGEPFTLRRQRMLAVRLMPVRVDEALGKVWLHKHLVVRVDFVNAARASATIAAPSRTDRDWEAVLREGLLNYDQAKSWRLAPQPATRRSTFGAATPGRAAGPLSRAAFDEDYPEVRIKADTTGVYVLTFNNLVASGYPANIPISQVSVHRHEFVENSTPPYVTIELPIEVDDRNNNGVFDPGDRINVWVENWAQRSKASWAQRAWGDGEVIYATAVSGVGARMPNTKPGWRNTPALTPLASYPWSQRWEGNYQYFTFPVDTLQDQFHWTDLLFYYDRQDTIRFETNHLDTTRAVTVRADWYGRRDGAHVLWAQYRNGGPAFFTLADSLSWAGRYPASAVVTLPGSTLGEGRVNTFRQWAKRFVAPPDPVNNSSDNIGLDGIDVTYWRRYRALRSYLSCNSGDATGEIQIQATGFSAKDVRVYDVTDSLAPQRLAIDPSHITQVGTEYTIEFQDSVAAGAPHRYVVFSTARIPPPGSFATVTRVSLTSRTSGDYLLIVPEAFLAAANDLAALRSSQGLNVVVAPFEDLCDEFNGGRKSSYAVKRFVRYGYENWNSRFVMLLGDASEDPLDFLGEAGPDFIPTQKINGPVGIPFGYEIDASDPWYVCMSNCDLSSGTPVLQDLFLGRLPANSPQQAQDMVNKLKTYENITAGQAWRSKLLLSADDDYSGATFFGGGSTNTDYCRRPSELVFKGIEQTVIDVIHNRAALATAVLDSFFMGDILGDIACVQPVPGDTCACRDLTIAQSITRSELTPDLISRLNDGRMWWNFQGHANQTVLTHEDLYRNRQYQNDSESLLNDDKPFLFSAFSCHANAFSGFREASVGPALGEQLVLIPHRGSIGSWASSGYEILPSNSSTHINIAWAQALFETPPHDEFLGDNGARVILGESIALALMRYVPTVQFNPNEKGIALTYHLLGDPATRLSIGEPEAAVLANQLPVTDGQPVRLHTVGDTLRLEATLASNVELTQISLQRQDPTGPPVTIPPSAYTLTPAFPDTAAGGLGGRRYQLSYAANLLPDSYHYLFHTTDRYGVTGNFDVFFQFLTQLRNDQTVLRDGDIVPAAANLSLKLLSPKPLVPASDLMLFVNGVSQPFTAAPVPGDASGREWVLSWTHAPYAPDAYTVRLDVQGGSSQVHTFLVGEGGVKVNDLVAFPNPFDESGTAFSFTLVADGPTDILIRVFTTAGRLIYERIERGMLGGYHQLPWNGVDAEGSSIANGVYVYKLIAANNAGHVEELGRLVRLRKPHHNGS
jgi:hypothetical protein